MSRVAIVVVSHNTRDELERCLASVFAASGHDVIVVDSASQDGSPEMVEEQFPAARLIRAPNDGYGAGANRGFEVAAADCVLLLNSDTRLEGDVAAALAEYLDAHPEVAVAGPRLRNPDGSPQPSCNHMPTPLPLLLYESGLVRLVARVPLLREAYLPTWSHGRSRRVPWVLGAALAIRCDAFAEAGGFDTDFFLYWEEVDLCRRVAEMGWEVHFAPVADVVHVGGASVATRDVDGPAFFVLSLLAFYRKHYGRGRGVALRLTLVAVLGARLALGWIRLRVLGDGTASRSVRRARSALAALAGRGQVARSEGAGGRSA